VGAVHILGWQEQLDSEGADAVETGAGLAEEAGSLPG
jgi:hypothetical protein